MLSAISGYSLALLDLAKEKKELKTFKEEASIIVEVLKKNSKYIDILSSYDIDVEDKLEIAKEVFENKIQLTLRNFILLLIEKNRARYLVPSLVKLISYINEELNVHEGIIYSVDPLDADKIKEIEAVTSKQVKMQVSLINKIDLSLLSGIRVEVDDEVIDNSVLTQLEKLKYELLEESRLN